MTPTILQLQTHIATLCDHLTPYTERFNEVQDLLDLQQELAQKIARFSAAEQRLSIGIMGQIKAGKSSLLNALLFQGHPVLPEAATPKTAHLTRITYGQQPRLHIELYTPEEWHDIERRAATSATDNAAKVARELVELAATHQLNVTAELRQGSEREIVAAHIQELQERLNDYVGDNGRYTALVKTTHLYLPDDALRGFDVVDTPGMNDPVQSRTQKTRDYMSGCDVVFFLSRASQFLDQADMELLAQQLPAKGVKHMVLIAGQFDSALLDDGYDRDSLAATEANVKDRLRRGAQEKMQPLAEHREAVGYPELAAMLRRMADPMFSSTFAHGYAHWPPAQWNDTMHHIHQELVAIADQYWNGYTFSQDDWQRLGNFDALTQAYEYARQDRDRLLQQQQADIVPGIGQQLQERLHRLHEAVENRCLQLQQTDIRQLEDQQRFCEQRIKALDQTLRSRIQHTLNQAQDTAHGLLQALQTSIHEYQQLQTRSGTRTETRSYQVSDSTWWKPWTWFSTYTAYRTITIEYQYLSSADAAEKVREYARQCTLDIEQGFNRLINTQQLRVDLRKSLIQQLDTHSEQFDASHFKTLLNHSLERLTLPSLQLETGDMTQMISQHFQGEITEQQQMDALRDTLNRALHQVFSHLAARFRTASETLYRQLDDLSHDLGQQLTADIHQELEKLRHDFADQQARVRQYQELMEYIRRSAQKQD
jgi:hypothetical protein